MSLTHALEVTSSDQWFEVTQREPMFVIGLLPATCSAVKHVDTLPLLFSADRVSVYLTLPYLGRLPIVLPSYTTWLLSEAPLAAVAGSVVKQPLAP
jgi:hypothetical protein